ncbi:MAG: hypothetical protein ACT4QF_20545 [Sporichthyaceae bacterium]
MPESPNAENLAVEDDEEFDNDDFDNEAPARVSLFPSSWSSTRTAVAVGVALTLAGTATFGSYLAIGTLLGSDPSRTITGSISLIDPDNSAQWAAASRSASTACQGDGGYSDMRAGSSVSVSDSAGKIVGVSALETGRAQSSGVCEFSFRVPSLPDSDFYQVQVGRRGQLPSSAAELKKNNWTVELSLGSY